MLQLGINYAKSWFNYLPNDNFHSAVKILRNVENERN